MNRELILSGCAVVIVAAAQQAGAATGPLPSGYTCTGTCGTDTVDGVVTASPLGHTSYQFVSTSGGTTGAGEISGIGGTNGSLLSSPVFAATAGESLNFYFNYVTSDGAGYSDYAWAALFKSGSTTPSAYLFTARTEPTGAIAPGVGLPADSATLNPATVAIVGGGPTWSPLGLYSGSCYDAGCGYTGWIDSSYAIPNAGNYVVEFGVSNWSDVAYDSGLAIDGITIGGKPVTPPTTGVPEPGTVTLLCAGLAFVALAGRRRRHDGC
jgi:PEP-CTERM motif